MAEEWRTWARRQRIIQQIDEYLRQTQTPEGKTAQELENSLFQKASKEEEYLQYVTKIIKYLKEQAAQNTNQNNSALNAMLGGQQGNTVRPTAMGRAVNNGGQIVHTNQGQLVHPGNAGAPLGLANTSGGQVTHTVVSGNQTVGTSGMMQGTMVPGPNRMPQLMQGNMANQGEMVNWQTHGKPRFQNCQNDMIMIVNPKHPGMGNMNQMNPQAGKMGTLPMSVPGQNEQVNQMNVGGQMARQGMTMQPRVPSPSFSVGGAAPHPRQGTPTPTGASPASQQQQHVAHSTLTFISPSPSSSAVPSPVNAGAGRPMSQLGAPSPGGMINTPGQPQQQQPSPAASNTSLEDRAYMEKIKQLQSKYLGPLRDVVQRFDNNDSENSRKVRNLLELIENPQKRSVKALETLKACEAVLERLGIQQREHRGSDGAAAGSKPASKESPIMVLFEAINFANKSPLGPHTIHRTLSPALKTLLGPDIEPHIPKYLKLEETPNVSLDTPEISDLIQGEIARLPSRFKINLETQLMAGSDDLILTCQLDDPNLPCVPPITLTLPPTYPRAPPRCRLSEVEYETTSFLRTVREILKTREYHLPDVCSLTMILESWEMSVRRACCPKPFIPDSVDPLSNVNILF